MAMINCPECGKNISDLAKSCPNCGFPMELKNARNNLNIDLNNNSNINNKHQVFTTYNPDKIFEKKNSIWDILAGLTLIIIPLAPIGIIIMWTKKVPKSSFARTFATVFFGFVFVIWLAIVTSDEKDSNSLQTNNNIEIQQENQDNSILEENNSKDIQNEESINKIDDLEQPPIEIFATDLLNSWSEYVGKKVTVSYVCSSCDNNKQSIQSVYDDDANLYLRSYVDNYRQFEYGDYITITGTVDSKYASYIEIKEAHIDYFGSESELVYNEGKSAYDERKQIESEEYEASFKENAESPSYDDLLRYPDSYKQKQIKVTVKIIRVEPDGIIFDGDIEATMSGETVALYDGRETKEPKLREGDLVTIYGYGKGTTTVKVQDVSGLIPKTVDKYDIPAIDIRYIEFQ